MEKEICNRSFSDEKSKQVRFFKEALSQGYTMAAHSDPYNLISKVGEQVTLTLYCDKWSENYLCKLHLVTNEGRENAFHLVPLWQILRFLKILPEPGTTFQGNFIIGIRKDELTKTFLPALRLPRK